MDDMDGDMLAATKAGSDENEELSEVLLIAFIQQYVMEWGRKEGADTSSYAKMQSNRSLIFRF